MASKRWIYIAVITPWVSAHWAGTISDSSGVTMVRNPEAGVPNPAIAPPTAAASHDDPAERRRSDDPPAHHS
jgi:hypothetical protein